MSRKAHELAARQTELRRRCAVERDAAAREAQNIAAGLARIDHVLSAAGRWASNPLIIAAGIGIAVLLGRSRALRTLGAGLGLLSTAARIGAPLLRLR